VSGQVRQRLPEVLVKGIEAISRDQQLSAQERYTAMVAGIFGYIMFQAAEEIACTQYALPEDQWLRLAQAFTDLDADRIAAVNYGLSFMNAGPSSYPAEPVPQPGEGAS